MLCDAMLGYVMLCYAVSFYAMLWAFGIRGGKLLGGNIFGGLMWDFWSIISIDVAKFRSMFDFNPVRMVQDPRRKADGRKYY